MNEADVVDRSRAGQAGNSHCRDDGEQDEDHHELDQRKAECPESEIR
jgi:hypothetical protein